MSATVGKRMGRKRKPARPDDRVAVIVLKDSAEYRDWVDGLSKATLIPVATIVRDALAKWAVDRGLPRPPSGPGAAPAEDEASKPGKGKP
jgi:hypothetical protein